MNDDIYFQTLRQQRMFGGVAEPTLGADIPLPAALQQTPMGMAAGMVWQQYAPQLYNQMGMLPGIFSPQGNIADQFAAREYWRNRNVAMQTATAADRKNMLRTIRGAAGAAGITFGAQQEQFTNSALEMLDNSGLGMMAASMAPDLWDALGGSRGSAAVMASRVHSAGRFQADAVTGRVGLSGESAGGLSNQIYQQLYGDGVDISPMMGLGAGRAGELYQALGAEGLLPRSIGTYSGARQLDQLRGDSGLVRQGLQQLRTADPGQFAALAQQFRAQTGQSAGNTPDEQIASLSGMQAGTMAAIQTLKDSGNPQFEAALRQFDASRVSRQLQSTAKAVTAMRDIFGDSGHTNVPMVELLEGLHALTQGGLISLPAGQAERMVRSSYLAAKEAGVSLQSLQGLTSQMGGRAEQLGLERVFGVEAAHGGIGFGGAFGRVGDGGLAAFGRRDRDQLALKDAELRLQAGRSHLSNLLGATMRMNDTNQFAAGSDAANLVKAIKNEDEMVTLRGEQIPIWKLKPANFIGAMTDAGVAPDAAAMALADTHTNQEFSLPLNGFVRRQQAAEMVNTTMARSFANSITQRAGKLGMTPEQAHKVALDAGAKVGDALLNMPVADRTNRQRRNTLLAGVLQAELAGQATPTPLEQAQIDRRIAAGDDARQARSAVIGARFGARELTDAVEAGWGNLETAAISQQYTSAQAMLDLHNPEVLQRQKQEDRQRSTRVRIDTAMAPLNRVPVFRRMIDQIGEPSADFTQAVMSVVGAVDKDAVATALAPLQAELQQARDTGDLEMVEAMLNGGNAASGKLATVAATAGQSVPEAVQAAQAAQAQFTAQFPHISPAQQRSLLQGTTVLATPDQQAAFDALRPALTNANQVLALHAASTQNGILGMQTGQRVTAQLQSLQYVRERLDKLGVNGDPAEIERFTKLQEALLAGGEEATQAADAFAAGMTDADKQDAKQTALVQSLREAGAANGIVEGLSTVTGLTDEGVRDTDFTRLDESTKQARMMRIAEGVAKADPHTGADAIAAYEQDTLAAEQRRDLLRADLTANLQSDQVTFQQLGRRKDRQAGDSVAELGPNELLSGLASNRQALEARARKLGFNSVGEALFASQDPELLKLSDAVDTGLKEVRARRSATAEQREAVRITETEQFTGVESAETAEGGKPAAPAAVDTKALKERGQRQALLEKFRNPATQGNAAINEEWMALPQTERDAINKLDAEQNGASKQAGKAAAVDANKPASRMTVTGSVRITRDGMAELELQEVPGTAPQD